jgi:GNAT superfamily N-acetyltransferase
MAIDMTTLGPAQQLPSVRFTQATNENEANMWMRASFGLEPSDTLPGSLLPLASIVKNDLIAPDSPWSFHLGYLDERPVATSVGFLHAGVVGIFAVSTAPTARNRGIGGAVTRRALLYARERRYRVGVLQATAMGYPVYERLGFKTLTTYSCHKLQPTEPEDFQRESASS